MYIKTIINSQVEAHKIWADKNKEYSNYFKYRSTARSFIRNKTMLSEHLVELRKWLKEDNYEKR
ncbi:hypothetical protein FQ087_00990 [Sporosarcina sp. ANT_H38]|nr:hypothetical protein FQ087_00990 [Sporosarcina sp. ANT_H38]